MSAPVILLISFGGAWLSKHEPFVRDKLSKTENFA